MRLSEDKRRRINELAASRMKPEAIAANLKLEVQTVRAVLGLEAEELQEKVGGTRRSPTAHSAHFKHWQQRDYEDFVSRWQDRPEPAAQAEAYDVPEAAVKWLCNWLRIKGAKLRKASRAPVVNIEALQRIVEGGK